jgi:hypothetical protein
MRDRIIKYVRKYFKKHNVENDVKSCYPYPTVKQVAVALKVKQSVIAEHCEELPLMLTSWFVKPEDPLGEHYIEVCE